MAYLLYKYRESTGTGALEPLLPGDVVDFSLFDPGYFLKLLVAGGAEYLKAILLAAWAIVVREAKMTDFRVYGYVSRSGAVLHYSIVSPASLHMPWLREAERGSEVGGCLTIAAARGKRIYPFVLRQIANSPRGYIPLYMIVESGNAASMAGMERAGFGLAERLCRRSSFGRPPQYETEMTG